MKSIREGKNKLFAFLLAVAMLLSMNLHTVFGAGEGIEIISLTSSNSTYTTHSGNIQNLHLTIRFKINAANAAGGRIEIPLETAATPYFATTMAGISFSGTGGLSYIDFAGAYVDNSALMIPFIGGTNAVSDANFTIDLAFDHTTWDGMLAPSTPLTSYTAKGVLGGTTSTSQTVNIISNTEDLRGWTSSSASGPIISNTNYIVTLSFWNSDNHHYWKFQSVSTLTLKMSFPEGTLVVSAAGGVLDDPLNPTSITWELDPYALIWNVGGNRCQKLPVLSFPDSKFPAGTSIPIEMQADYYLADGLLSGRLRTIQNLIIFTVRDVVGGVRNTSINYYRVINAGSAQVVPVDVAGSTTNSARTSSIETEDIDPVSDVKLTWYNDLSASGVSTNWKANLTSVTIYRGGVNGGSAPSFAVRWVATINDASGGSRTTSGILPATASNNTLTISPTTDNYTTSLKVLVDEYVDSVEFYPQYNSADAMPPESSFYIQTNFKGFTDRKDYRGLEVRNGTDIWILTELTWLKKDSTIGLLKSDAFVRCMERTVNPEVTVSNLTERLIYPGTEITLRIGARCNNIWSGMSMAAVSWKQPTFFLIVPNELEFDPTQEAYTAGGYPLTIIDVSKNDLEIYKIQAPESYTVSAHSFAYFDLKFTVKNGVSAGGKNLTGKVIAASVHDPATNYHVFGIVPNGSTYIDNTYTPGGLDLLDGFQGAPILAGQGSATVYTVQSQQRLDTTAWLFDSYEGGWMDSRGTGAVATVPLEQTGQFKIEIANNGNVAVGNLRLYDILPALSPSLGGTAGDDNTVINPTSARDSAWTASFESLDFDIVDANGNSIKNNGNFTGSNIYISTQGNPTISHLNLTRTGGSTTWIALSSATPAQIAAAKSFYFDLGAANTTTTANKLPGGAKIIITGTIKAPDTATAADIGELAYNTYAVTGSYYNGTGGAGTVAGQIPVIEETQTFELTETNSAEINTGVSKGFAFKDCNGNGVYDAGDEKYAGVTVNLYKADASGNPLATVYATTTTDASGEYEFTELPGGDYFVEFKIPSGVASNASFSPNGTDVTVINNSQVNGSGMSAKLTVAANGVTTGPSAGIKRVGKLTVEYRLGTSSGTLIGSAIIVNNIELPASGSVTPGTTTGYDIPTGYRIMNASVPSNATKSYSLNWNIPEATLVFVLEKIPCTVTFDQNYTGKPADTSETVDYGNPVSAPTAPTRTGYTFGGWYTDLGTTTAYSFSSAVTSDFKLYAKWNLETYTITYASLTGADAFTPKPTSYTVESSLPVSIGNPTKDNYVFLGWTVVYTDGTTAITNSTKDYAIPTGTTGGVTLTANWEAEDFTITYSGLTDADAFSSKPTSYTVESTFPINVDNPTKAYHTFDGWTVVYTGGTAAITTPLKNYAIPAGTTGNITLTANWSPIDYTVVYDDNYSASSTYETYSQVNIGNTVTAPTDPTRTGYTFQGWAKTSGGTAVSTYRNNFSLDAAAITDLYSGTNTSTTLYAVWKANSYTLTFKYEDSTTSDTTQSVTFNAAVGTLPSPTRIGYTFGGWWTGQNGTGIQYTNTSIYNVDDNTSLYAKWTADSQTTPETFIKLPNKVSVKTGDYIDYTLSGIGNPYSNTVDNFRITDNPPVGLTFVSGSIPAFTNGTGLTYKILYSTNLKGETELYSGLSATTAFSFNAPTLQSGEYITSIVVAFDSVPLGFGSGNKIVYTFKVTATKPGTKLVNEGTISFQFQGITIKLSNEGNSTVTIYGSNPQTGDNTSLQIFAVMNIGALAVLLILAKRRKRKTNSH